MIAVDYDPLATNVVSSLSRPGGNITGVFVQPIEFRTPPYDYAAAFASAAKERSGAALVADAGGLIA